MRSTRTPRAGFTLVELLVAIAVGGLAIVAARTILDTLADQADRITGVTADLDRIANGDRLLRALAGRIEMGATPATGFAGDPTSASFTSWCEVADGWQERCRVTLRVIPADSTRHLHLLAAVVAGGEAIPLMSAASGIELRYLSDASNGSWYSTWARGITIPLAIGILTPADTLIVRIGERG